MTLPPEITSLRMFSGAGSAPTASVSVNGFQSGFFNSDGSNPYFGGDHGYNSGFFNLISFPAGLGALGSMTGG